MVIPARVPADHSERDFVARQYATADNLAARQRIYRFSTSKVNWHEWVFERMLALLPGGARLLEIGCGNGALWRENLARVPAAWAVTLTDLSLGMLDEASRGLGAGAARFRFARADAQALPFPDNALDAVVANHMLYHVPDRPRAYREIVRVLKPGGALFAATNGDGHVIEIRRLIERHVPLRGAAGIGSFSLAGAKDELERFFGAVDLLRLRGELRVPDAEMIVDYVRSMDPPEPLSEEQIDAIRRKVAEEVRSRGCFSVSTEAGLCIATRSA